MAAPGGRPVDRCAARALRFSQMVRQPIERIAEQMNELQKALAGARRAGRLLATEPSLPDGRGVPIPAGPLAVDLDDVAFASEGDSDVLVDLDLHLARSEEHTSELQSLMRTSTAISC